MAAPSVRQIARKSIGVRSLPVASLIIGTTFWATKPPRLPTELMAAMPAAAVAPLRKVGGSVQKTGWPEDAGSGAAEKSELEGVAGNQHAQDQTGGTKQG